ncbi:MAG: amidase [Parasphingorhabdus sp.]
MEVYFLACVIPMNLEEYANLDAISLATLVRQEQLSATEVATTSIGAIEQLNPILNAVVMKNYDNARKQAANASNTSLAGVPFLIKDVNVFTQDMPTTFSCAFFETAKPRPDSLIVKRWRESGLMVMGKSNTPEFAEDFVCESTFRGPALNPWDTTMTTGGSSGGAAAAVASGMVPVAHATDLGGSIRIPAACCGVYGLKPTTALNPVDYCRAELASGFNSDHVVTRSVRDSAAVLDATALPVPGYRYQQQRPVESYLAALNDKPRSLRIGVTTMTPMGDRVPQRQQQAVALISELLEKNGHHLIEYHYPKELEFAAWMDALWMFDVVDEIDRRIKEVGREPRDEELDAMTRHIRERVAEMSAMDHYYARVAAHSNSIMLMGSMTDLDMVLSPALGSDPIPVGSMDSRTNAFDYATWMSQGNTFAPYSYICNMTGQPAASVPVFVDDGPPVAIQLAGQLGDDLSVLQISAFIEAERPWIQRKPPIYVSNF